jgi:hypothetical protein
MQEICPYCRERPLAKRKGAKTCGSATCRKVKQRATPERIFDEVTADLEILEALIVDGGKRGNDAREKLMELFNFMDIVKQDMEVA